MVFNVKLLKMQKCCTTFLMRSCQVINVQLMSRRYFYNMLKYSYVGSDAKRREGVIITQCMTIQSTNNNIQVEDTRLRTNVLWLTNQFHKLNLVFRSVFELK